MSQPRKVSKVVPDPRDLLAALISVSVALCQITSLAYTARPLTRGQCIVWCVCLLPNPWPVGLPNYTAWWQRHTDASNLPKVTTQRCCPGWESNPRPIGHNRSLCHNVYRAYSLMNVRCAACHRHGEHQVRVCGCQGHDSAAESERVQPRLVTASIHPSIHWYNTSTRSLHRPLSYMMCRAHNLTALILSASTEATRTSGLQRVDTDQVVAKSLRQAVDQGHTLGFWGLCCQPGSAAAPLVSLGLKWKCSLKQETFRPHWMRITRSIATDDPVAWWSDCMSVCHAAALCKTAELIEVLFGVVSFGDQGHVC